MKKELLIKKILEMVEQTESNGLKSLQELEKAYKQGMKKVVNNTYTLYSTLDEITIQELQKGNRHDAFRKGLIVDIRVMGEKEEQIDERTLIKAYTESIKATSSIIKTPKPLKEDMVDKAEKLLRKPWVGKENFSDRIWNNKDDLLLTLDKLIYQSIALGDSKDKAVEQIMKQFNVAFNQADRIIRTELMHIINQAQYDVYTSNGYKEYEYLAHLDKRTSKICESLNGQVFKFKDAQEGVNYPVMHPRCRSTIIPII